MIIFIFTGMSRDVNRRHRWLKHCQPHSLRWFCVRIANIIIMSAGKSLIATELIMDMVGKTMIFAVEQSERTVKRNDKG